MAHDDISDLPCAVRALTKYGLEIKPTDDVGPYKKIIPALVAYPNAFVVTADDDVFYGEHWLAALVREWNQSKSAAICHRAHRVRYEHDGQPLPYMRWEFELDEPDCSPDVFATGCGGVLFTPQALHPDVLRQDLFTVLSPYADDVWLYCMLRRAGNKFRKTGNWYAAINLPDSQKVALALSNQDGGNDRQLRNIINYYGEPLSTFGRVAGE
ncbi:glycosyltransferase family 2 protein [Methylosinus sp. LW4]|uniref:glycosyltransferase family 2 protein n=1 Tax=Methylosinus sp. LW4 TaxID=136993 RepID=UPI0012F81CD7|nr:glycosyltransferase family 2 protein [Methylosinus sp. LW4]